MLTPVHFIFCHLNVQNHSLLALHIKNSKYQKKGDIT